MVESRKTLQAKLAKLAAENRQLRDRLDGRLIELLVLLEQIEELKKRLQ